MDSKVIKDVCSYLTLSVFSQVCNLYDFKKMHVFFLLIFVLSALIRVEVITGVQVIISNSFISKNNNTEASIVSL